MVTMVMILHEFSCFPKTRKSRGSHWKIWSLLALKSPYGVQIMWWRKRENTRSVKFYVCSKLSMYLFMLLYIVLCFYPSIYVSIYASIYSSMFLSIYLSIYVYFYLSLFLFICLYIPLFLSIF